MGEPDEGRAKDNADSGTPGVDDQTAKDGGKPDPKAGGQPPEDDVTRLQGELRELQAQLDAAKKAKAVEESRQKAVDAIANQRATSLLALDAAATARAGWRGDIDTHLDKGQQDKLKEMIDSAIAVAAAADKRVVALTKAIGKDESAVKDKADDLAAAEKQYADAQKELSQLPASIKEAQGRVDKLRGEVQSAVDASDWHRAFYKNDRLDASIRAARKLADADEQERIVKELKDLERAIDAAEKASTKAKATLDARKQEQKDALQEQKQKQADLEPGIELFL